MKNDATEDMHTSSGLPAKLSKPAQRALAQAGIRSLEQLGTYTEQEIAALHGIGPNALKQFREAFSAHGLTWKPKNKSHE